MRGPRAVLFDLDDTLYCEHDYVRSGFAAVGRRLSAEPGAPAEDELYRALHSEWVARGRGRVFDVVVERLGLTVDIEELVDVYRDHEPTLVLYPDADRALARLESSTVKLGILTDGVARVQRRKLRALSLDTRVPCIVVTDDFGLDAAKPNPAPYRTALDRLQLEPADVVYVGDNPHKDFIGARGLGMPTVRVRRPTGDHADTMLDPAHEADRTISSLDFLLR
jgi:putative hydrolase of the HAD superfamily